MASSDSASRRVREQLDHPVIDADGHWIEPVPAFLDYLSDAGGPSMVDAFLKDQQATYGPWYQMTSEERRESRSMRIPWWNFSTDARDRATFSLPALYEERLDEFGIDFAIIYPSLGLGGPKIADLDLRRAFCRALNVMSAEMFAGHSRRMTPAATIPSNTPEEAADELAFAVNQLHMKVAMIHGTVNRSTPATAGPPASFVDNLVLDPVFDYDPFWRQCVELKVAVTAHGGTIGSIDRRSPSNYCFNHVGHFAQAHHIFARALFFAGVTYRFPDLNFGFLEGGVGWARTLVNDLTAHWHVRSPAALRKNLRPSNLDLDLLRSLYRSYGPPSVANRVDDHLENLDIINLGKGVERLFEQDAHQGGADIFDDFAAAGVSSEYDIAVRFAERCFFGCEADDPATAWAFDRRLGIPLKAVFGSDVGHFDVADPTEVVAEAYELVERGFLDEKDFEAFTFTNAAELHGGMNRAFFAGTVIEPTLDDRRMATHVEPKEGDEA